MGVFHQTALRFNKEVGENVCSTHNQYCEMVAALRAIVQSRLEYLFLILESITHSYKYSSDSNSC